MRKPTAIFACVLLSCLVAGPAFSAIKYKRLPHCPNGLVSKKTCECHRGTSGRYRFCHAGEYCSTTKGKCLKEEEHD